MSSSVLQMEFTGSASVYLISDRDLFLHSMKRSLSIFGFERISSFHCLPVHPRSPASSENEIILLHDYDGFIRHEVFNEIILQRSYGYKGIIVFITEAPSTEQLVRALRSGADDYLMWGPDLHIAEEIVRFLENRQERKVFFWEPELINRKGFFRTLGLSPTQIQLLTEYSRGFPRQAELAKRLGKSEAQMRKSFSRLYEQLSVYLPINNQARLAQLLSIYISCG